MSTEPTNYTVDQCGVSRRPLSNKRPKKPILLQQEETSDEDTLEDPPSGGASLVATAFILAKAMMGSTVVTMPKAFVEVGNRPMATLVYLGATVFIIYLTVCLIRARNAHQQIVGEGQCRSRGRRNILTAIVCWVWRADLEDLE